MKQEKKQIYKKWWFWAIIGIALLTIIYIFSDSIGKTSEISSTPTPAVSVTENPVTLNPSTMPSPTPIPLPEYEIVSKEDLTYGDVVLLVWNVVIREQANTDQMQEIAVLLVEEAKSEKKFNALAIPFLDFVEYIGHGNTLGTVDYAPNGDWDFADTVNSGEYASMKYNFQLREKDWSKQLTQNEVTIWKDWIDTLYEKSSETYIPTYEEINKIIAKKYNMDAAKVAEIVNKQILWTNDGLN